MLSYRHGYHAGNFADVFKHFLLVYLLNESKKNKPFTFIDPFAAAGIYYTKDEFMMKNKEYLNGINKIIKTKISNPLINDYLNLIYKINNNNKNKIIKKYPGSCLLAKLTLDPEDKIYLSELHNNEFKNLKKNFIGDDRILIEKKNAYSSLSKVISSYKGNKLVLIDPSYELKDEYHKVANLIKHINFQFPKVNLIIWYPLLEDKKIDLFENQITKLEIKNFLHIKIELDNSFTRMKGTGFFLTNFSFNYLEEIKKSLYEILNILKEDNKKNSITFRIKKD